MQSRPVAAAVWMVGAVVSFTSMAIAGREAGATLDTFEIMLYRSLIGLAVLLVVAGGFGTLGSIRRDRLRLHLVRNLSHFAGQNLWFFAVTAIPLAQVFALEFSQPLWVALAAPFFLGEHMTRARVGASLIGFLGILIVARPGVNAVEAGTVAALIAAFCFAGSAIATKRLTAGTSITCILFWLTLMQAAFSLICAGADGDIALPGGDALPWVVVIALGGLIAHFCLTTALTMAPAVVVMPLDFLRLPVIAILGAAVYAEALDGFVFLGAALIFGANYANVLSETRRGESA